MRRDDKAETWTYFVFLFSLGELNLRHKYLINTNQKVEMKERKLFEIKYE